MISEDVMTLKQIRYAAISLVLIAFGAAAIAQDSRPKVGIKSFRNPSNYSNSTIGNGLTDILSTELGNTGKFNVIDRSHIDELTKEIDFGSSGYGNKSTFAQKGNLLGVHFLLMGEVTNFSYTEQRGAPRTKVNLLGPNTIVTDYLKQADVRVDFHLVDVSTGEHVIDEAGNGHATDKSEISEINLWRGIIAGSGTFESSSSLIGRATMDAVKDIVRKLSSLSGTVRERSAAAAIGADLDRLGSVKGQVAAEEGGGLWILGGIGSGNGLKIGDHLRLIHENIVKDKAGKEVYRKPIEIGSMEVTDVSQPDHAEARFIPGTTGGAAATPRADDVVTVDMDFARKLRGGGSAPPVAEAGGVAVNSGSDASSAQLEGVIKRADSYVHDQFWSRALDEYTQAAAINPNDPRVPQGQALSHYMLGDFIEGDESAEKLLHGGGTFTFPVAHYHGMGICNGELKIQQGKLTYSGGKGDGFDVTPQGLASVEARKISKGVVANEKIPDLPIINIRWRDPGGHEKDYQMLPYMYSKQQQLLSGKNFASAFPMGDSDVQQMQKFEESVVKLIQKYVK
jgi:curli biogenesis system outer membrane secretion channel CsgG